MVLPLDLTAFDQYLTRRRLANEKQRPYLVNWVRRFLQDTGERVDLEAVDRERIFSLDGA